MTVPGRLKPPARFVSPLQWIAQQKDDDFRKLVSVLDQTVRGSQRALVTAVEEEFPEAEPDGETLVDALVGLQMTCLLRDLDLRDVAIDMGIADSSGTLSERLVELAETAGIRELAKVGYLTLANERNYNFSKAVSEIRPVFTDDLAVKPVAAVINHQLHISYRAGDVEKSFYVALDSDDLRELSATVQRALDKEASLENHLREFGWVNDAGGA